MKGCRPLTDSEVSKILSVLSLRDQALFLLGIRSGFRISELLSLKLSDVFQNGNYVDRITVGRRYMKKKMEGRTVILHPEARNALILWIKELHKEKSERHPDLPIFLSRETEDGIIPKAINRKTAWHLLKKAYAACGLTGKLGTHSMRKTFAKRVHEKLGRDLMKTQKALGHARVTSTVSYLSFAEEEIDEAILKS